MAACILGNMDARSTDSRMQCSCKALCAHTHTPTHLEAAMGHAVMYVLVCLMLHTLCCLAIMMVPDVCVCVQQGHAGQRQGYPTNVMFMGAWPMQPHGFSRQTPGCRGHDRGVSVVTKKPTNSRSMIVLIQSWLVPHCLGVCLPLIFAELQQMYL